MDADMAVPLYGGGALIFDEYGRLKFNVHNRVDNARRQSLRLKYLWRYGHFAKGASMRRRFSHMHHLKARNARTNLIEEWN
jgi:hypothetical protein